MSEASAPARISKLLLAADCGHLTTKLGYGALEGTVETLTVHAGTSFNIFDMITGRSVRCNCTTAVLDHLAPHLTKKARVLVYGAIQGDKEGRPTTVDVERFEILGTAPLPQPEDLLGLYEQNPVDVVALLADLRDEPPPRKGSE